MKIKEIKLGARVKLRTKRGNFECLILESPRSDIILIKLDSGYNIGIREEDVLDVKEVREKKEKVVERVKLKRDKSKKNIAMVITGGTISARLDSKTGAVHWLTNPEELMKFYPEILEVANVSKIEVPFMKASEDMDSRDWGEIAKVVSKLLEEDNISGVVVTHGTDFLHYTSAALAFSLGKLSKPVVLTYSQRSSDRASSDARLNLVCAAQVAVSDVAEVVLVGHATENDDYCLAIPGTKVRKMHTSKRDAFRPVNARAVAKVFPDRIEMMDEYNPRGRDGDKLKSKFSDKVALVKFYPGMDDKIIDYYVREGYKGLVIEVSGLGHVSTKESRENLVARIRKAVKSGITVCAACQTIYGRLDPLVYSNGRELEKTGVIFLRDMLSETAFVKLSWVLGNSDLRKDVKGNMLKNFAREFSDCLGDDEFLN
jgi:glutamyl-tRNA(Gln) amidotransferase subunit D